MTWLVLDMDEGVLGAYTNRSEALEEHRWGPVIKRHKYGVGSYEYVTGSDGDTSNFFVATEEAARRDEWDLSEWEAAGKPIGRLK